MVASFKDMTNFLVDLGTEQIGHTDKSYLSHLIAVHRDLQGWGCDDDLCRAGMFHSIYGTELFQGLKLDLDRRPEMQRLIGERAERIAFVNCVMDRSTFDRILEQKDGPFRITNRITKEEIVLSKEDYDDLCRVHLCDWLEQVGRAQKWDYRRSAYRRMAQRLGGIALRSYERVFQESLADSSVCGGVAR